MSGIKRHILVVDDNEYNREILLQNLEDLGFPADEAGDGHQALQKIADNPPGLVLLDVMMPGMDGIEVTRRLRADPRTHDLPVIIVTARADSSDVVTGLRAGANDYVTKPVDIDVLMARIETHLRLRDLQERERRAGERLHREVAAARAVQDSLLPQPERLATLPGAYGLRLAALWQPCETLCGDFWDIVSLADGSLGIMLIDFAGTGVVPALNTFRMKSLLHGQCAGLYNVELTMARLNTYLVDMLPEDELALCLYARFSPGHHIFDVVAAGAPPPMVYRARNRAVQRLHVSGRPAGAFPDSAFEQKSVTLEPGDKIVLYTDGLLKAGGPDGAQYSEVKLADLVAAHGEASPEEIAEALRADLAPRRDNARQCDDITVVIAEAVH